MPEDADEAREYIVYWRIDVTATSERHAAELAREIQRDPDSLATFFHVVEQGGNLMPALDALLELGTALVDVATPSDPV